MALISFAVTAKLICVFVFGYADCWFSHEAAHLFPVLKYEQLLGDKVYSLNRLCKMFSVWSHSSLCHSGANGNLCFFMNAVKACHCGCINPVLSVCVMLLFFSYM